jgi:hypothetical protein
MKKLILIASLIFALTPPASAADCTVTCLDVYTKDGQLVVEGKKGNSKTTVKKATVKKRITVAPKKPVAQPKKSYPPDLIAHTIAPKKVIKRKPTVKRKVSVKKTTATLSLADRLAKALPTGGVAYQPGFEPLVKVPVIFWSDIPKTFNQKFSIVGEMVDVTLHPSFTWSFGDGSIMNTTDPGAAYPNGSIQHTYLKPGTYLVTVLATWGGTWSHNGTIRAVTGEVKTTRVATVKVVTAPTIFVN